MNKKSNHTKNVIVICDCIMAFLANSDLILQISHAKTLNRGTIILSKDIDKYVFMCGSNFYEADVKKYSST